METPAWSHLSTCPSTLRRRRGSEQIFQCNPIPTLNPFSYHTPPYCLCPYTLSCTSLTWLPHAAPQILSWHPITRFLEIHKDRATTEDNYINPHLVKKHARSNLLTVWATKEARLTDPVWASVVTVSVFSGGGETNGSNTREFTGDVNSVGSSSDWHVSLPAPVWQQHHRNRTSSHDVMQEIMFWLKQTRLQNDFTLSKNKQTTHSIPV